jgi:peptidoglycan hydrolase CwlO-like protein
MKDIWSRIDTIISYFNLSDSAFERQAGLSPSYIRKTINSKSSIGHKQLEKIIENFPKINAHWIRTGEGPMINGEAVVDAKSEQIEHMQNLIDSLNSDLKDKDKLIEDQKETIKQLKELLRQAIEKL